MGDAPKQAENNKQTFFDYVVGHNLQRKDLIANFNTDAKVRAFLIDDSVENKLEGDDFNITAVSEENKKRANGVYGIPENQASTLVTYDELLSLDANTIKNTVMNPQNKNTSYKVMYATIGGNRKIIWWDGKKKVKHANKYLRKLLLDGTQDRLTIDSRNYQYVRKRDSPDHPPIMEGVAVPDIQKDSEMIEGKKTKADCLVYYPFFNKAEADPDKITLYYTQPIVNSLILQRIKGDIISEEKKKTDFENVYNGENVKKQGGKLAVYCMGVVEFYRILDDVVSLLDELKWTGDKANDFRAHALYPGDPMEYPYGKYEGYFSQPIGYKLLSTEHTSTYAKSNYKQILVPMAIKLIDYIRAYHNVLEQLIAYDGYKPLIQNTDFKITSKYGSAKENGSYSLVKLRGEKKSTRQKSTESNKTIKLSKQSTAILLADLMVLNNQCNSEMGIDFDNMSAILCHYKNPMGSFYKNIFVVNPINVPQITSKDGKQYLDTLAFYNNPYKYLQICDVNATVNKIKRNLRTIKDDKEILKIYTTVIFGKTILSAPVPFYTFVSLFKACKPGKAIHAGRSVFKSTNPLPFEFSVPEDYDFNEIYEKFHDRFTKTNDSITFGNTVMYDGSSLYNLGSYYM